MRQWSDTERRYFSSNNVGCLLVTFFRLSNLTFFPIVVLLLFILISPAGAQENITREDLEVKGVSLSVDPADQTVPLNTPTVVKTVFATESSQLLRDMIVKGVLRGPGFSKPITLSTLPNHPFSIPGLPVRGEYYLENIRLERDGVPLIAATPSNVIIRAMDIILTKVETRPLSLQEIREKGIVVTDKNFTAYNISIGFQVDSQPVKFNFPVVYTPEGPVVPRENAPIMQPGVAISRPPQVVACALDLPTFDLDLPQAPDNQSPEKPGPMMTGLLVFNNDIAFLNQFFSVMFIVTNNAPEASNLYLKNVTATLELPALGLREAQTNPPRLQGTSVSVKCPGPNGKIGDSDDIDVILASFSGMAEFLAEGLTKGSHTVKVTFDGTLSGGTVGDLKVSGSALGCVVVRNPEFSVTFFHPDIVRIGEEYDINVTMTNTSSVDANLVSMMMPRNRIFGAELLSDETIRFETIRPGETVSAPYRLRARETGRVTASAFEADGAVAGKFVFTAAVGEKNIPLSPDSLVIPGYAKKLPVEIVNAGMLLLGEAHSIATAPPGSLPDSLPVISRDIISIRVLDMANAGQEAYFGASNVSVCQSLALDWLGNSRPDAPFEILRRLTSKGPKLSEAFSAIFSNQEHVADGVQFQQQAAGNLYYKKPWFSVISDFSGQSRVADLCVLDSRQNRLGRQNGVPIREIPFGDLFTLQNNNGLQADWAVTGVFDSSDSYSVELTGRESGALKLGITLPGLNGGVRQIVFANVPADAGSRSWITIAPGQTSFILKTQLADIAAPETEITGVIHEIPAPPLDAINAILDVQADKTGHAVAIGFNQPVDAVSAANPDNYSIPGKEVYNAFVQPSRRVVILALNSAVSPLSGIVSVVRVSGVVSAFGGSMNPSEKELIINTSEMKTPGGQVFGLLKNADGKSLSNATVYLREYENETISVTGKQKETISIVKTDEFGNYRFDYVRMLPDAFEIIAKEPQTGFIEKISNRILFHEQQLKMDIVMRGRGTLKGTVQTSDGLPAAGAVVILKAENMSGYSYFNARTDYLGQFVVNGVPLGRIAVTAQKDNMTGYAAAALGYSGENSSVFITVSGIETGVLEGRALRVVPGETNGETTLEPTPQAVISIYRNENYLGFQFADQNGCFKFEKVPAGSIRIRAQERNNLHYGAEAMGTISAGQTLKVDMIFRGHGAITGKILFHDGRPAPNIAVSIQQLNRTLHSDAAGEFSFTEIPAGSYTVTAYDSATATSVSATAQIMAASDFVNVILALPETGVANILGRVTFSDGITPVKNAKVYIADGNFQIHKMVYTGGDGRYSASGLKPGSFIVAAVSSPDGRAARGNTSIPAPGIDARCDLKLNEKGTVKIVTKSPDGSAPVMANVRLGSPVFQVVPGDMIGFFPFYSDYHTGDNGEITIENVHFGDLNIEAWNSFYPTRTSKSVKLSELNNPAVIELRLNEGAKNGKVKVTVISPETGEPLLGAPVSLRAENLPASLSGVTAAAAGETIPSLLFSSIPAGRFKVEASDDAGSFNGLVNGYISPQGGDISLEIHLRGLGEISGLVKTAAGQPAGDIRVIYQGVDYPFKKLETKSSADPARLGEFFFNNIPEGKFCISIIDTATSLAGRINAELTGHRNLKFVEIRLEASGTVSGTILNPADETPVPNAQVILFHERSPEPFGYAVTLDDGRYSIVNVPLGAVRVEVFDPVSGRKGKKSGSLNVNLQEETLDVMLEARGGVTGVFLNANTNEPIPRARITLSANGLSPFNITTCADSDGRFRFDQIGAGMFTLKAEDSAIGLTGSASGRIEYEDHLSDVTIYSNGTVTIRGKVYRTLGVLNGQQEPVANAIVTFGKNTGGAVADAEGNFILSNAPLGAYTLAARDPMNGDSGAAAINAGVAGVELNVDICMKGLGSLSGVVLNGNGSPASGVRVTLKNSAGAREFSTDNQGLYHFNAAPLGSFLLTAYDPVSRLSGAVSDDLTADSYNREITITLESAGRVTGRVLRPDGVSPFARAPITLSGVANTGKNFTRYSVADASGYFNLDYIPLSSFRLMAGTPGAGGTQRMSGSVSAQDQTVNAGDLIVDAVEPQATDRFPQDGAVGVDSANPGIRIIFSESMDEYPLTHGGFILSCNKTTISGAANLSADGKTFTFRPSSPLLSAAAYTMTLASTVTDRAGNPLRGAAVSMFATRDIEGPKVIRIIPADKAAAVSPYAAVVAYLNEPFDSKQINSTRFILTPSGGASVAGVVSFSDNNPSIVFTPNAPLDENKVYSVSISGLRDLYGNVQAQTHQSSFSTIDTKAPSIQLDFNNLIFPIVERSTLPCKIKSGDLSDVKGVQYFVDGVLKHTSENPGNFFLFNYATPDFQNCGGQFLLQAVAYDKSGNYSAPASIIVSMKNDKPPVISISAPGIDSSLRVSPGQHVNVNVTGSDDALQCNYTLRALGDNFLVEKNGTLELTSATDHFIIDIPTFDKIAPGVRIVIQAEAVDVKGQKTLSNIINLQMIEDVNPPVVIITSPAPDAKIMANSVIDLSANVSDDYGVRSVQFTVNDVNIGSPLSAPPYSVQYAVPAQNADSQAVIGVTAEDAVGKTSSSTVNVMFQKLTDTGNSSAVILSPSENSLLFPGERVKFKVGASDPEGVATVNFYVDDVLKASDNSAPYEYEYIVEKPAGSSVHFRADILDMSVPAQTASVHSVCKVIDGVELPLNAIIEENNAAYDNQTLIVRRGAAVIKGKHTFANLLIKETGRVSHVPTTVSSVGKLDLTVTGDICIGIDAAIDVMGGGYLGGLQSGNPSNLGYTFGNVLLGAAAAGTGGSHGGPGGYNNSGQPGATYGSIIEPDAPGSGGSGSMGGNGGGVIILTCANLRLDGAITADGADSSSTSGAGAGGSIQIRTGIISGSGVITSRGGNPNGDYCAGGGGRIAIACDKLELRNNPDNDSLSLHIKAFGGVTANYIDQSWKNGGAGTIHLTKKDDKGNISSETIIDNNGHEYYISPMLNVGEKGVITALTPHSLTDASASFSPGALKGMRLFPNIQNSAGFRIIDNTSDTISTLAGDGDMTLIASTGDRYRVESPGKLILSSGKQMIQGDFSIPELLLNGKSALYVSGALRANSIRLSEESVIYQLKTDAVKEHKLTIEAHELIIDSGARIDASKRGYLGARQNGNESDSGRTFGNANDGGSGRNNGGSHGGFGGKPSANDINSLYGSIVLPVDSGSGGGASNSGAPGGSGGGVISINILDTHEPGSLILDGTIEANGENTSLGSGGAGGSILIKANKIIGRGKMTANGGDCSHRDASGGGGGRIAVYYSDAEGFNGGGPIEDAIDASGGMNPNTIQDKFKYLGGPGTVYIKNSEQKGKLFVKGKNQSVAIPRFLPEASGRISALSANRIEDSSANYAPNTLTGMKLIPNIAQRDIAFTIVGNDRKSIYIDSREITHLSNGLADITSVGAYYGGVFSFPGDIAIIDYKYAEINGDVEIGGDLALSGSTILTHPASVNSRTFYLSIKAEGTVQIDAGCQIYASDRGFPGGITKDSVVYAGWTFGDVATPGGSANGNGASHGGLGGRYSESASMSPTYDSLYEPAYPGSGGGFYYGVVGGNGGGVIFISAQRLNVIGRIEANGGKNVNYPEYAERAGGGAGGSIHIHCDVISGPGPIEALGGVGLRTGGGGGRIAIEYQNASEFNWSQVAAFGGKASPTATAARNGGAGSIYLKQKEQMQGELIIDNNNVATAVDSTPIPSAGPGVVTGISERLLTNANATFMPYALTGMKLNPNVTGGMAFTIVGNTGTTISTSASEGLLSDAGAFSGSSYIGEHHLFNLTIRGLARVITKDRLRVAGVITVAPNASLKAENYQ